MKRLFLSAIVFATLLLAAMLLLLPASAQTMSGTCGMQGGELTWSFDSDTGTLTVSGNGQMKHYYETSSPAPWASFCEDIDRVVIEDGVTSIGSNAFRKCTNLKHAEIADTVSSIGSAAFRECFTLERLRLPASLSSIEASAFSRCVSLKEISIPDGVLRLEMSVFEYCISLGSVRLPSSLIRVEANAFYACTSLSGIELPASLANVGKDAFNGCNGLIWVRYGGTKEAWRSVKLESGNESLTAVLQCTDGLFTADDGCGSALSGGIGMTLLVSIGGAFLLSKKKKH